MENADVYKRGTLSPGFSPADVGRRAVAAVRVIRESNVRTALALGFFALAVRVIWVLAVRRSGFALNDTLFYDVFATQLANGHGYTNLDGSPSAAWPPGFPFVLSLPFRLFGSGAVVGELTNAFLGAASVPLLYRVALTAFGRREAVFCAVAFAVFPAQVIFTDLLLSETLFVFMLIALLALLTVLPRTVWAAAVVGLVVGSAALTRGEGGLLALVPIAVWSADLDRRTLLKRTAVLLGAVALVVVPWTVRNKIQLGHFVPNSTNGGQTLWSGHNPHADGNPTYAPESFTSRYQAMGKPDGEVALDKALKDRAVKWALSNPVDELLLIPKKLLALAGPDSQVFGIWVNRQESAQPVLSARKTFRLTIVADAAWYGLLVLFLFSAAVFRTALWRAHAPVIRGVVVWIGASLVLYGFVLFGQFRYHVPLQPLMLLVVAPLVCAVWASRRRLAAGLTHGRSL
jgi:4-amino-4-deoxy-L-arabinose transferase-like glycosyltransferase